MTSEKPYVHRFAHPAMGTIFEAMITGCEMTYARQAAQAAFAEVDRLERFFSFYSASSEISQLNRLRPGESIRLSYETYECLAIAERIHQETAGAFDVNFRYRQKSRELEENSRLILSVTEGFYGAMKKGKYEVDLGGIGKGYALDRALLILAEWEVDHFLFHAGTSTALARGDAPGLGPGETGWPVAAGAAYGSSGVQNVILLKDRALSGSGSEVKENHIIDPRRAEPADQYLAVWVSHPRATEADALSTAFMAMTLEEIERFCQSHSQVWASVLTLDRRRHFFNLEILV